MIALLLIILTTLLATVRGVGDIDDEPHTLTVPAAAKLLGCSSSAAYEAIRTGDFPVPVLRIGRKIVVPKRPLFDELGIA